MKLIVIGLDGADPDLIQKWDLPNIKTIMKNGCYGKCRSVLPPITAPAWASITTGKDPSWHGVSHFVDCDPFLGSQQVITSESVRCKRIWHILNENGLSCGTYMVPVTYPVEKIKGFMATGMPYPDYSVFQPKVNLKIRPFIPWLKETDIKKYITEIYHNTSYKFKLLEILLDQINVDMVFMVESNTDSIQHKLFHGEGPSENRQQYVEHFFRHVDALIGELMRKYDCPVLLVSDHGFGKLAKKKVYVNRWLHDKGLLSSSGNILHLKDTKTYFFKTWLTCGFIKRNIDDIADELRKEPWVDEVFFPCEMYTGPLKENMPEIAITFSEEYTGDNDIASGEVIEDLPVENRFAGHRMDAFWACTHKISLETIMDIAPAILRLMGREEDIPKLGEPRI